MITVLKGAGTVVADAAGSWAINTTGNPGMATGGMGDVLAGIIGGLLAQGYSPWDAACLGVYLHGLAADFIARSRPYGYTASEVARILPRVMRTCTLQPHKETLC
jgi:NAD(P)H-hydrate epimerase